MEPFTVVARRRCLTTGDLVPHGGGTLLCVPLRRHGAACLLGMDGSSVVVVVGNRVDEWKESVGECKLIIGYWDTCGNNTAYRHECLIKKKYRL